MFCPNCGFELDGDLRYCTECGYALEDAKAVLDSASNEVAEEPSVINEAAEEIFASDETEKEPSAGAEAGEEKSPVESEPVADEEDDQPKDDMSSGATPSIPAVRADRPKPSNPVAKPVAAPAPVPAVNASARKRSPRRSISSVSSLVWQSLPSLAICCSLASPATLPITARTRPSWWSKNPRSPRPTQRARSSRSTR